MLGAIDDAVRLAWTLRRKPLESFLLPVAAFDTDGGRDGVGLLVCRDGSLVSLIRIDGVRSMMGGAELDDFVELAARRLNNSFTAPGHALHVVFERAPDGVADPIERAGLTAARAADRLGLALGERV